VIAFWWWLTHTPYSNGAFTERNGPNALVRYARGLRVRFAMEGKTISPRLLASIMAVDPPPCRCGAKGTRIIGRITFCRKCGPPTQAVVNRQKFNQIHEDASSYYEAKHKSWDYRDLARTQLHANKQTGHRG
jgi:hypothetical protein